MDENSIKTSKNNFEFKYAEELLTIHIILYVASFLYALFSNPGLPFNVIAIIGFLINIVLFLWVAFKPSKISVSLISLLHILNIGVHIYTMENLFSTSLISYIIIELQILLRLCIILLLWYWVYKAYKINKALISVEVSKNNQREVKGKTNKIFVRGGNMKRLIFLGICIVFSALLISASIVISSTFNRYKMYKPNEGPAVVTDGLTGTTYYMYPEGSSIKVKPSKIP